MHFLGVYRLYHEMQTDNETLARMITEMGERLSKDELREMLKTEE